MKKMKLPDRTDLFKKYRNKWIARTDNFEIIASGNSLDEILEKAKKKGYDDFITAKIPDPEKEFIL